MKRPILIVLTLIWVALVYFVRIAPNQLIDESDSSDSTNNSTQNDSATNSNVVSHPPIYFQLNESTPETSDQFTNWLDSLRSTLGSEDTVVIKGMFYSGESSGELIATSRALAVKRQIGGEIEKSRIRLDYDSKTYPAPDRDFVRGFSIAVREFIPQQRKTGEGIQLVFKPKGVNFNNSSEASNLLSTVVDKVSDKKNYKIMVTGYAEKSNSLDDDYQMGRKRAWVVKKWLMDNGIPAQRIITDSKGADASRASSLLGTNDLVEVLISE